VGAVLVIAVYVDQLRRASAARAGRNKNFLLRLWSGRSTSTEE
jgi:hypothetical protein